MARKIKIGAKAPKIKIGAKAPKIKLNGKGAIIKRKVKKRREMIDKIRKKRRMRRRGNGNMFA